MIIAIDASKLISSQPTGVEVYCQEIIRGLSRLDTKQKIKLYTPKVIKDFPAKIQVVLPWPFKFWTQLRLGFELLIRPPDVFFSPGYVLPFLILLNKKTKKVVTIHDLAFMREPKSYSFWRRLFLRLTARQAVKYAHAIITPTEAVKQDVIKYYNCPAEKIIITYYGYKTNLKSQISNLKSRKKRILYIGRIEEKKNINNLVSAFQIFRAKHPDYQLILAGKPGFGFNNIQYSISNIQNIQHLGYITPDQKEQLLTESTAFAFISRAEGFGFPLLESFAHHLPVLASDIPTLREVGAGACLFADPNSPSDIAAKLEQITTDQNLRQELITRSRARLKDFNWSACAQKTLSVLTS